MNPVYFDGVVGEKPEWRESFKSWLVEERFARGAKWIDNFEVEKTPEEMEIIRFVQQHVLAWLKKNGRKSWWTAFPLDHIHLFSPGGVKDYTKGLEIGSYGTIIASVLVDRHESAVYLAIRLFHELMHSGEYVVIQRTTQNTVKPYRTGLVVVSRDDKKRYFHFLSEAVTAIFEREFFREVLAQEERFAAETVELEGEIFSRAEETQEFNELVDLLWEKNEDSFSSREEIVALFIDAYFTGHLLKIARLVEKTQGKGAFRKLGEKTGWSREEEKVGTEP